MKVIYQLIEKETGRRCEPMAAEFPGLQETLEKNVVEQERWKYYVLILMEERELADVDPPETQMVFSSCPLIALQAFISLGAKAA